MCAQLVTLKNKQVLENMFLTHNSVVMQTVLHKSLQTTHSE